MISNIKLGQIFYADSSLPPTKASVYLKPVGNLSQSNCFDISSVTIDSLNFSKIEQGKKKIIANDNIDGYTSNGFIQVIDSSSELSNFPSVFYPITVSQSDTYYFWARVYSDTGNVNIKISINGTVVYEISTSVAINSWEWISCNFDISQTGNMEMSLGILENISIDKIFIASSGNNQTMTGEGLDYSLSPYITVHFKVYETVNDIPSNDINIIYDYLTTREHILDSDWFNVSLKALDSTDINWQTGNYALVLFTAGSNVDRYILWDIFENDEYIYSPSLLKATGD